MEYILGIVVVLTPFAAIMLWYPLRREHKPNWLIIIGECISFTFACVSLRSLASEDYGVIIAFLIALMVAGTLCFASVLLAITLPGKRKIAAAIIFIVVPLSLFISIQDGNAYSPDSIAQQNGQLLIQALNQYLANNGKYPPTLDELVPKYVTDLKVPKSLWGWLYTATDHDFALGFVTGVDWTYSIALYKSSTGAWDYLAESTGPFKLQPTPGAIPLQPTP